jgi:hypothetical protein
MLNLQPHELFFVIFMSLAPFIFFYMIIWMYNNHPSTWKYDPFANMPGTKFRRRLWELQNEDQAQINQVQ